MKFPHRSPGRSRHPKHPAISPLSYSETKTTAWKQPIPDSDLWLLAPGFWLLSRCGPGQNSVSTLQNLDSDADAGGGSITTTTTASPALRWQRPYPKAN